MDLDHSLLLCPASLFTLTWDFVGPYSSLISQPANFHSALTCLWSLLEIQI